MIVRGTMAKFVGKGTVFIETGTREGDSVALAMELGAKRAYSTEFRKPVAEKAMERFKKDPRVSIRYGHSPDLLIPILNELKEPATFWIDAHAGVQTTVLEELDMIGAHAIKTHTVLVDDMDCFKKKRWGVSAGQVLESVHRNFPRHAVWFEDGYWPYDVLVARILP